MSINRISLYHIETLLWIDRIGTFGGAAKRLNTTQPAISARVREIEGHMGVALFRREGRCMSLTPAGRQLVRDFQGFWGDLQAAMLRCGGMEHTTGIVRIGTGEIVATSCLPPFLAELKSKMPDVSLEVEVDLTANLIQQLLAGQTDIAFAAGPVAHPSLKSASIGEVELLWLAGSDMAFSIGDATGGQKVPIWTLASHSPIYGRLRNAIAASPLQGQSLNICNNARLMVDIARAGGGIGIFPRTMVQAEIDSGALSIIPGMPTVPPVEFVVAKRLFDNDPLTESIFTGACSISL